MISVGQRYLVQHNLYTKFVICIVYFLLYSIIVYHPVLRSIIVIDLMYKFYLSQFLHMT